jgi:hypothetical protein
MKGEKRGGEKREGRGGHRKEGKSCYKFTFHFEIDGSLILSLVLLLFYNVHFSVPGELNS